MAQQTYADEHLAGHLKAPPDERLFEVISA
jgi:hypothetical protein